MAPITASIESDVILSRSLPPVPSSPFPNNKKFPRSKSLAQNAKEAEIKSEALSPQDNIIADGSYGLTDGASIEIKKQ